ncbi:hypothetical protein CAL7716_011770 [Calothrix sp. PCC 7716]|nr:hypothetical protein CAL7716_011770 [Calothrix sp. PCC 7716]
MILIRDVVEQALNTGYLTLAQENLLRVLLRDKYEIEDLNAFMSLQEAAMDGLVKQESRELSMFERDRDIHYGISTELAVHACV